MAETDHTALAQLAADLKTRGQQLGFQQIGITDTDLTASEAQLSQWLAKGYQAGMQWMGEHGNMRTRPQELLPGTVRVISLRMNYLPADTQLIAALKDGESAYVSRYALGRDYHKLIRKRLSQLAKYIETRAEELGLALPAGFQHRAFVDSAPVAEKPLAAKAGLGWQGKHTLVINREAGSWFFLGEILSALPLPIDQQPQADECGECTACLKVCPTDAFPRPYELDAGRCISYLTIEHKGAIPEEFREPIGNRVFGCDDCQAICPWNKYAHYTREIDFLPRHKLDNTKLVELFQWREQEFLDRTAGSPLRRTGFENWQRNLAIGLGNAPKSDAVIQVLERVRPQATAMVQEHIDWALAQQRNPTKKRKRKIRNSERAW
ncbi:tRNA epoxyqueuosine(34) reductase QueG [Simiduia sp. 21SJ11W-1]|uniref:tRNA epoxyqueuosine(34) reductase QueG n=1 Tax=Simiduia sp. 21SJ11W-1 TaxID=2909669 RepID=UPI00209FC0B5|nr:tRNA epoxyqueuosine(34) reductase QueG [Simiduia sp. 21SJ11W-1]UTA48572.1 tRNA epoxyqueuosine(34) reductase QueG [Simiduia sp. 21SJ11W-1]